MAEGHRQTAIGVNSMMSHNLSSGVQMGMLRLVMMEIVFDMYTAFAFWRDGFPIRYVGGNAWKSWVMARGGSIMLRDVGTVGAGLGSQSLTSLEQRVNKRRSMIFGLS